MRKLFPLFLIVALVAPSSFPGLPTGQIGSVLASAASLDDPSSLSGLYRTLVAMRQPADWARLARLGATVLEQGDDWALVLADEVQLEALARLRFEPRSTDELGALVAAHAQARPWLATSLQPLLSQAAAAQKRIEAEGVPRVEALADLRASLHALAPEQKAGLAALSSVDDDADGLTNTQESWWGTDPMNPDSDGDGASDGDEVAALKAWLGNETGAPPATGKPFLSWPDMVTDSDYDSVPDLAERWELGLNMNRESTDRDKFDDGQELFGITRWDWGALPRSEDTGYIFAEMPAWVKTPGDHPLVAAFPVPEIDVVESSLHVEAVTTVTTDHTIGEGTERSYSTAKMEGTSTSEAETKTWNEWQEVSKAIPNNQAGMAFLPGRGRPNSRLGVLSIGKWGHTALGTLKMVGGVVGGLTACGIGVASSATGVLAPGGVVLCGLGIAKAAGGLYEGWHEIHDAWNPDIVQEASRTRNCDSGCKEKAEGIVPVGPRGDLTAQMSGLSSQDIAHPGNDTELTYTDAGLETRPVYAATYPVYRPVPVTTTSHGSSIGGEHTTTHTEYEEHTITNGEAFSTSESWGTATAVDSSHAADLWFTYQVRNTGHEYAREIADLAFNIYIGDDPNPAYTYFVAPDLGGDGKFHNFMPDEEHTYTSRRISLTLEQMKAVDLGGPVRIVVEDFTYGVDELFYEDASNAGVLVAMEDGTDDGDESIDTYLIPTWGEETVLDVLARYFPHETDVDGNIIAIWTPEYRADTPSWCHEGYRTGSTLWCKHALSTADWWNIYTDGMGDGSEGFQDTPAAAGSVALFRFNKDSDLDGYSDRSEIRLGTDPNDASSHPSPELIAGLHSIRSGDHVTATLSFLNTGLYDAYGVEAVMIAPDDSISITNNTVGGSGRVRALKQVVVGSRIMPAEYEGTWNGTSTPASAGYYEGTVDLTYTFTVDCSNPGGCDVGSGTWSLAWDDGAGATGTLDFGDGYLSPTPLDVGSLGLQVALLSGTVDDGDTFNVEARTPRDTFQYTINHEPYTEPVVIVSYNDPQGNHRFVTDKTLTTPTQDLAPFAGQMLPDVGVEIVTQAPLGGGEAASMGGCISCAQEERLRVLGEGDPQTTHLVINNPTETTLTDAHLFLEFVNISGTVACEVPVTVTLPAGPSVVPVEWSTAVFSPTFQSDEDYIVMAFWTDYEGNILDTAARPLSSFQEDPQPSSAMSEADELWDFGTAQQGTLLQRRFTLASIGYMGLLTHLGTAEGVTIAGPTSRRVAPGDMAVYTLTLNTQYLPVGAFERIIPVRTSDLEHPTRTITVQGEITPMAPDSPGGAIIRPLDWDAIILGDHSAGEWVEFTHTLGPDPQSLHPVKVYSQDYGTLWGVGKYATPFGQGTTSYDMFGDGRDGVMPSSGNLDSNNGFGLGSVNGTAGSTSISVVDRHAVWRINPGDYVLIHQTRGTGAGNWELNKAVSNFTGSGTFTLASPLSHSYMTDSGANRAQIVRVPQYSSANVTGTVTPLKAWDGYVGGIFVVMCSGSASVSGAIHANGLDGTRGGCCASACPIPGASGYGFWGGDGTNPEAPPRIGWTGESVSGLSLHQEAANGSGGGGGNSPDAPGGSPGGSGSHATAGSSGTGGNTNINGDGATLITGNAALTSMTFGGGGGGGTREGCATAASGGAGGGIVAIFARNLTVSGIVATNGGRGGDDESASGTNYGGGGAGGSVFIRSQAVNVGTGNITASGGLVDTTHGGTGGGGLGRIRVEYCDTLSGSTNPPASTQKLDCYIVEQIEASPYDRARLSQPESFTGGRTYKVQYGRRLVFSAAGEQTESIRMPKQVYASASLDALISNTGVSSGGLNLSLDIGNDGTADWNHNATTTFPATLAVTDIVDALNAYLVGRTDVPWGTDVDVPVRVQIDRQAQVILTNLVLSLQFNQPGGAQALDVEMGADRPLDWTTSVAGDHSQGEAYDFTHTLGPDPATIHPCKVYDQSGSTLKGVGKYCSEFGSGTLSYQVFGTGRDGDLTVGSGQTVYVDNVRTALSGNTSAGQRTVPVASTNGFSVGDEVLVIQMQGTGAGNYEFGTIDSVGSGSLTLVQDLANTYTVGGNSKAQALRVPHYQEVTVQGTLTARAWDGSTGGIIGFRASGVVNVLAGGSIRATGIGFRGGAVNDQAPTSYGWQGEGYGGNAPTRTGVSNNSSGGGGGRHGNGGSGAGGGGNANAGSNGGGPCEPGHGGTSSGSVELVIATFGGGGGGAASSDGGQAAKPGGNGGGIMLLFPKILTVTGPIVASGVTAADASGGYSSAPGAGGGAGGSILVKTQVGTLGDNLVVADKGKGGAAIDRGGGFNSVQNVGGDGSVGRIRIEYQTLSGSTNPTASTQQVYFYAIEQVEQPPYTTTRFYLPESFAGGRTYIVQFGRRFVFAGAGEQTNYLRLNRQMYGTASLDALISNTGVSSGNLNLCLDVGNDGTCDSAHNASTDFPATLNVTGLTTALNEYLLSRTDVPWGSPVDVPIRVQVDRQADVMLTNMALNPIGAKTRFLRLLAQTYSTVVFSLEFNKPGVPVGPLAFTVDVGADGTIDWSYSGTPSFPAVVTSPNLATAFDAYLAGRSGDVDVPLRIVPSPFLETALHDFSATPSSRPDVTLSEADIAFGVDQPVEGSTIPVTAVIHNAGAADSGGLTASFYADSSDWGSIYIGSAFVPDVPTGGSAQANIQWNTLGFTGTLPVQVVLDPYNRVAETNEGNNEASTTCEILTRPDLRIPAISLSDDEPVVEETIQVTVTLRNAGQTNAGTSSLALYDGNPDADGILLGQGNPSVPGGDQTTLNFIWTPTSTGSHRLFSLADTSDVVDEYDEGNNQTWRDVYVGLAGPLLLNSGTPSDVPYTTTLGYGYMDVGQPDVVSTCGGGTTTEETLRRDPGGQILYRFDHLLPGHFYHLDVTLYECDGAGRQESIYVDENPVAGPEDLGNGEVHRLSLRLDPAVYADRTISVTVEAPGIDGAVVNAVNLHDVDYRYADCGGSNDPQYPGDLGYGWLDGVPNTGWGTLPYRSVRVDQTDAELRYRFDSLDPSKRYNVHLTFWQPSGTGRIQKVQVDGLDTGLTVDTGDYQTHRETVAVPSTAYATDGSIVVSIVRINASTGAMCNEIALEEETLSTSGGCVVQETPYFSEVYGSVTINGQPAAMGTIVEAVSPRGDTVGCFSVGTAGQYGFMRIYGEDATAVPPIPGMRDGEPVAFRVNGAPTVATPLFYWHDDRASHRVDLAAGGIEGQSILLSPGWNLASFRLEPPAPLVLQVFSSINDRYDRVLGENGIYAPDLDPVFNTLSELHAGQGYYVRLTGSTSASALIEGIGTAANTPLPLHAGWNWIGYLPETALEVTVALQSIDGHYQRVLSLDKTYDPALPEFSTLQQMQPGEGYLIHVPEPVTLTYPAGAQAKGIIQPPDGNRCDDGIAPTPYLSLVYGGVQINNEPAPAGTWVEAITPRGEAAACFTVEQAGQFGLMHVFGEDATATPVIGGFRDGEPLAWRVNGLPAVASEPLAWQDDKTPHTVDLSLDVSHLHLPLVIKGE